MAFGVGPHNHLSSVTLETSHQKQAAMIFNPAALKDNSAEQKELQLIMLKECEGCISLDLPVFTCLDNTLHQPTCLLPCSSSNVT